MDCLLSKTPCIAVRAVAAAALNRLPESLASLLFIVLQYGCFLVTKFLSPSHAMPSMKHHSHHKSSLYTISVRFVNHHHELNAESDSRSIHPRRRRLA